MYIEFTLLSVLSLVLMVLWATLIWSKKKKVFLPFAIAHILLYVDCFALGNHFNFEIAWIMLAITGLMGLVQLIRGRKIRRAKMFSMYVLFSAVPVILYLIFWLTMTLN